MASTSWKTLDLSVENGGQRNQRNEKERERERLAVEKKERKKERKSGLGNPEAVDASANYDATKRCRSETASASANWTVAVSRSAGRPEKKTTRKKNEQKKKQTSNTQQRRINPSFTQRNPVQFEETQSNPVPSR